MALKTLTISSSGLKNIIKDEKDFIFTFGNHQIHMNSIFAEFASPIVSRLHYSDPTIDSICIDFLSASDPNFNILNFDEIITDEIISLFNNVFNGLEISINESQSVKIRIISILIGNEELFHQINKLFPIEIDISNVDRYISELQMFEYLSRLTSETDFNFSSILDFISSNFYLIDENKLKKIPKKILLSILNNEFLKIESEDDLFAFIRSIFDQDNDNELKIDFYEKICLQNLNEDSFKKFISDIDSDEVTGTLWQNIRYRFNSNDNDDYNSNKYASQSIQSVLFDGDKSHAFNGIIHLMTQKCKGNVDKKEVVRITSSSRKRSGVEAHNAADLDDKSNYFFSKDEQNAWIKYDFKDRKIRPTHYSIRSYTSSRNSEHLMNWVIEGSNTGNDDDWKTLDVRNDVTCLNDFSAYHTFQIQKNLEPNEFYQYLRLRQTGYNAINNHYLSISALEYFGNIM